MSLMFISPAPKIEDNERPPHNHLLLKHRRSLHLVMFIKLYNFDGALSAIVNKAAAINAAITRTGF